MTEKIMTLHPAGKQGVNIDKGKYDMVRQAVEETLRAQPGITFSEMTEEVGQRVVLQLFKLPLLHWRPN